LLPESPKRLLSKLYFKYKELKGYIKDIKGIKDINFL